MGIVILILALFILFLLFVINKQTEDNEQLQNKVFKLEKQIYYLKHQ